MLRRPIALALTLILAVAAACTGGEEPGGPGTTSSTATPTPISYVALGDSFASGEGAPPYDATSGPCHRSARAWAVQLSTDVARIDDFAHPACAGAKTEHLTGPWTDRGLPPQIPATPDPSVTLVTLTIGGNDIGFSSIVLACVLFRCPEADSSTVTTPLHDLSVRLADAVYPALEAAYPNARIVHVGYPFLAPAPGQPVRGCAWLDAGDQARAEAVVDALNDTIAEAADDAGVTYVDVEGALEGHELCSSSPWVVAIGGNGQAHPNASGQRALEEAVAEALDLDLR